ncbi:MAG: DNA repair protein RecO [Thermodesulfobacteriota bacterium]|nr:DNA repair protein RecO [Thermodesulfobacteriota bacterium]
MPPLSSPAIMLRAAEHGDYDRIITFFTLDHGKMAFMAKGAKKSVRRFAGILELFSILNLVWTFGRGRGLPILQEASVVSPFEHIRTDIVKTAYASCWCEMVSLWMEKGQRQVSVYELLAYLLDQLNAGLLSAETLHIAFQMRFMAINGFRPGLEQCSICASALNSFQDPAVSFDVKRGGVVCEKCGASKASRLHLSKGTVKLLSWVLHVPLERLNRVRFSRQALDETMHMLEVFVPYHLGKETKSLKFLKQLGTGLAN